MKELIIKKGDKQITVADKEDVMDALDNKVSTSDPRLSDTRTPKSHTHNVVDLSNYMPKSGSGGGTAGYFKILNIKTNQGYLDDPITFEIYQRDTNKPIYCSLFFNGGGETDPTVSSFKSWGSNNEVYIYKASTNNWQVIVKKIDTYDAITVENINCNWGRWSSWATNPSNIFTHLDETITSLPSNTSSNPLIKATYDISNVLTDTDTDRSLSANQGKVLKGLIDGKVSTSDTRLTDERNPKMNFISASETTLVDLNSYKTAGFYYNGSNTNTYYIKNCPWSMVGNAPYSKNRAFFLLVETWGQSNNNWVKQTLTYYFPNSITYVRVCNSGTWQPWKEVTLNGMEEIINSTQSAGSSAWTGVSNRIVSLTAGTKIYYWLKTTSGSDNVTLDLTLANGDTTGAKGLGPSYLAKRLPAYTMIELIYDGYNWFIVNPTNVVNDLTTGGTSNALSAEQGKTLKSLVDSKITNGTGTVTSTNIADKTIVNGDIADNAAIAYSKLSGVAPSTHSHSYLPTAGGTMTGGIIYPQLRTTTSEKDNLPYAGAVNWNTNILTTVKERKSLLGTATDGTRWWNILSIRHRNGTGDGNAWGMILKAPLTTETSEANANLTWQRDLNGTASTEKTIIDTNNMVQHKVVNNVLTRATNNQSTAGYFKILTIGINGDYIDSPIQFTINKRLTPTTNVQFYVQYYQKDTSSSSNPRYYKLNKCYYDGQALGLYVKQTVDNAKAGTFDIYTDAEAWSDLSVTPIITNNVKNAPNYVTITPKNEFVTSLPSGYIQATRNPNYVAGDDSRLSNARTPTSHAHGNLQNNGQVGSTVQANKNVVTDANGKITTENKPTIPTKTSQLTNDGDGTNVFVKNNDSRLSNARTPTSHTHTKSQITDFPTSMTPTSHTHGNITNAGAIGSTANLPVITTTSGKLTTGSFGTGANTFCQGNDSRITNAVGSACKIGFGKSGTTPATSLEFSVSSGTNLYAIIRDANGNIPSNITKGYMVVNGSFQPKTVHSGTGSISAQMNVKATFLVEAGFFDANGWVVASATCKVTVS